MTEHVTHQRKKHIVMNTHQEYIEAKAALSLYNHVLRHARLGNEHIDQNIHMFQKLADEAKERVDVLRLVALSKDEEDQRQQWLTMAETLRDEGHRLREAASALHDYLKVYDVDNAKTSAINILNRHYVYYDEDGREWQYPSHVTVDSPEYRKLLQDIVKVGVIDNSEAESMKTIHTAKHNLSAALDHCEDLITSTLEHNYAKRTKLADEARVTTIDAMSALHRF